MPSADIEAAAHVATIVALVCAVIRVLIYCLRAEPSEGRRAFETRMTHGDYRPPAVRERMQEDPAFRARVNALLGSFEYRRKAAEVTFTRQALKKALKAAKHFGERVKAAEAAKEKAAADGAGGGGGGGDRSDGGVAQASARLLAASGEAASVNAKVTELAAKHNAAKLVVVRLIMAVANQPERARARQPGRSPPTREAVAEALEMSGRAARGTGAGATVEPTEISCSAATMEEGASLL